VTRLRPYLIPLLALAVVAAIVAAVVVTIDRDEPAASAPKPTGEQAPAGLERFYGQEPTWRDCEDDARCAWVEVPLDYADPAGETIRLRVREVPATGDPVGRIVVNPGGPGGSGVDFATQAASSLGSAVREQYGVVGVDPRGVGRSEPALDCLDDEGLDAWVATDQTPDDDVELARLEEADQRFGRGCVERSGALASHVTTVEAARDMDVVRAVLGDDELSYYGASYGTALGATYAALFPDRVGRLVLDGAVAPDLTVVESAAGQNEGFQRALEAYLQDCVRDDCPLGDDVAEAQRTIGEVLDGLDEQPLKVGRRELTQTQGFYGIAVTLYGKENWPYLTQALEQVLDDDGSLLLSLSDFYFDRDADGSYTTNGTEAFQAISCLDASGQPAPSDAEVAAATRQFREVSPVFGDFFSAGLDTCEGWAATSRAPAQVTDVAAVGAAPILVVGTTRDPATPYEWSQRLADALDSGVLLTREGDGHTAVGMDNDCVDDAVAAYFVDGTVPDDGTVCEE
jgi:pimeloyl-ACP methyl ester carboxylesterase